MIPSLPLAFCHEGPLRVETKGCRVYAPPLTLAPLMINALLSIFFLFFLHMSVLPVTTYIRQAYIRKPLSMTRIPQKIPRKRSSLDLSHNALKSPSLGTKSQDVGSLRRSKLLIFKALIMLSFALWNTI